MAVLKDFHCPVCDQTFEELHTAGRAYPSCPCGNPHVEWTPVKVTPILSFVPMYPGCKAHQAGYIPRFNKPAEKVGIQVPR